jgi:putative sugar O-methyltransferase
VPTTTTRRIRGRQLLLLDAVVLLAASGATSLLIRPGLGLGTFLFLLVARLLALVRSGTYQNARALDNRTELARICFWVTLASFVSTVVTLVVPMRDEPGSYLLDTVAVLVGLAGLRFALAGLGVVRRAAPEAADGGSPTPMPPDLGAMVTALAEAPEIYRPSRFWEALNREHLELLQSDSGFGGFKRTVNTSYFQFGSAAFVTSLPLLIANWLRHPDPSLLGATVTGLHGWRPRVFAIVLALYANTVRHRPGGHLLDEMVEPGLGNPITVRYEGRMITEDMCHSVEEFASITTGVPRDLPIRRAVEIGAGYGRLAYVFARARPDIQYHVVDIPPALYISQRYLTTVLPDVPVFRFRPFDDYNQIAAEIGQARLVFLEPQQLEKLPDGYADLIVTVSTLHEMRADQIVHYLRVVDRLCGGAFYSKQWRRFYNDLDDVTPAKETYPIPRGWKLLFERSALAPRSFFEALYLTRPARVGGEATRSSVPKEAPRME